jgi:exodeoxyribonuclease VII small subunit
MADERDTYEATRARLEEIAASVRKKDVSLEKSIELLEEGVRLANLCTEQVDQAELAQVTDGQEPAVPERDVSSGSTASPAPSGDEGQVEQPDDASEPASAQPDDDVLAEAFADVEEDLGCEAGEGQTEAFAD